MKEPKKAARERDDKDAKKELHTKTTLPKQHTESDPVQTATTTDEKILRKHLQAVKNSSVRQMR